MKAYLFIVLILLSSTVIQATGIPEPIGNFHVCLYDENGNPVDSEHDMTTIRDGNTIDYFIWNSETGEPTDSGTMTPDPEQENKYDVVSEIQQNVNGGPKKTCLFWNSIKERWEFGDDESNPEGFLLPKSPQP